MIGEYVVEVYSPGRKEWSGKHIETVKKYAIDKAKKEPRQCRVMKVTQEGPYEVRVFHEPTGREVSTVEHTTMDAADLDMLAKSSNLTTGQAVSITTLNIEKEQVWPT